MNLDNAVALIRDDVTTIAGQFLHQKCDNDRVYTFKAKRSLARSLNPGDHVLVISQRGLSILVVQAVHDQPQIDAHDAITYRWAFQRVDEQQLESLERQDRELRERLKAKQRQHVRQQTLDALGMTESEVQRTLSHQTPGS